MRLRVLAAIAEASTVEREEQRSRSGSYRGKRLREVRTWRYGGRREDELMGSLAGRRRRKGRLLANGANVETLEERGGRGGGRDLSEMSALLRRHGRPTRPR